MKDVMNVKNEMKDLINETLINIKNDDINIDDNFDTINDIKKELFNNFYDDGKYYDEQIDKSTMLQLNLLDKDLQINTLVNNLENDNSMIALKSFTNLQRRIKEIKDNEHKLKFMNYLNNKYDISNNDKDVSMSNIVNQSEFSFTYKSINNYFDKQLNSIDKDKIINDLKNDIEMNSLYFNDVELLELNKMVNKLDENLNNNLIIENVDNNINKNTLKIFNKEFNEFKDVKIEVNNQLKNISNLETLDIKEQRFNDIRNELVDFRKYGVGEDNIKSLFDDLNKSKEDFYNVEKRLEKLNKSLDLNNDTYSRTVDEHFDFIEYSIKDLKECETLYERNENLDNEKVEKIENLFINTNDKIKENGISLIDNPSTTSDILDSLAKLNDPFWNDLVAKNDKTNKDTLLYIANNVNTMNETLDYLSNVSDNEISNVAKDKRYLNNIDEDYNHQFPEYEENYDDFIDKYYNELSSKDLIKISFEDECKNLLEEINDKKINEHFEKYVNDTFVDSFVDVVNTLDIERNNDNEIVNVKRKDGLSFDELENKNDLDR